YPLLLSILSKVYSLLGLSPKPPSISSINFLGLSLHDSSYVIPRPPYFSYPLAFLLSHLFLIPSHVLYKLCPIRPCFVNLSFVTNPHDVDVLFMMLYLYIDFIFLRSH